MRRVKYKSQEKKKKKIYIAGFFLILLLLLCLLCIFIFSVKEVEVEGNTRYTKQEIKNLVMTDPLSENTLYLYWKYRYGEVESIPFINKVEVSILSPGSVKIEVYEKDIVAYIEYLGSNIYFDKDGIIVESTGEVLEGILEISGLEFDHIIMYEPLPVEDERVFDTIVNLTRLLDKSGILPNRIIFNSNLEMTLVLDEVNVLLGADENMDEKFAALTGILPKLSDMEGILHLENYDENTNSITFE